MNSFLETYTMLIRTITPVHIGSGDRLSAAVDFVRQNGNLVVIDHERLLQWVAHQPDAERLADQLTQAFADPARGINEFLNSESVKLRLDIKTVQAYVLPYSGRPKEVFAFIKNSTDQPYLPGSSLKGALRSAILRGVMLVNPELQDFASRQVQEGIKEKRTRSQQIEARLFATGAPESRKVSNYDLNRLLIVRDSSPLPQQSLSVRTVRVLSVDATKRLSLKTTPDGGAMEIHAEMLTAERIRVELVLQRHLLSRLAQALGFRDASEAIIFLPEFCRNTAKNLLQQDYEFYRRHGETRIAQWFEQQLDRLSKLPENMFYLLLGWGTGYDAKTITDLLGERVFSSVVDTFKNTQGLGRPGNRRTSPWLGADDSPKSRKLIVAGDNFLPPGWLEVRLEPWGGADWWSKARQSLAKKRPVVLDKSERHSAASTEAPKGDRLSSVKQDEQPSRSSARASTPTSIKPLIAQFSSIPKVGDRFEGIVFDVDERGVLLEIPGLDPDEEAYALLSHEHNQSLPKTKVGQTIVCEVLSLKEEQKEYWCIICQLG